MFCIVLSHWIHQPTRKRTSAPSATTLSAQNPGNVHLPKENNLHTVQCMAIRYLFLNAQLYHKRCCTSLWPSKLLFFCWTVLNSIRKPVKEMPGSSVKQRAVANDLRARTLWRSIKEMFTQVDVFVSPCMSHSLFTYLHAELFYPFLWRHLMKLIVH